jgi:hypothetical protein
MLKPPDENTKHQAPNTRKAPNLKLQVADVAGGIGDLDIGISLEFGVFILVVFGWWEFVFRRATNRES